MYFMSQVFPNKPLLYLSLPPFSLSSPLCLSGKSQSIIMALTDKDHGILDHEKTFASFDFGLDKRLIKAVAKLGYIYPTLVQVGPASPTVSTTHTNTPH
jgi:hypothetical protein